MAKKYKHKKLGWIAKERNNWTFEIEVEEGTHTTLKELVENSSDWEEIIEEDFIYEARNEFKGDDNGQYVGESFKKEFRQAIEKHMPRITEEELDIIDFSRYKRENMIELLKSKGLMK